MRLAHFRRGVGEAHRDQWLGRRVAVLEVLEHRTTERVFALLRDGGEKLAVALDDEMGQAALDIGFGFPGQFVTLDSKIPWRWWPRDIDHDRVLDILCPRLGDGSVGEPHRFL